MELQVSSGGRDEGGGQPTHPSAWTFDDVRAALTAQAYRHAKSIRFPHAYTLKTQWADPVAFEEVVNYIYEHGYTGLFFTDTYKYLNVDGHRYWAMGWPVDETELINREGYPK